jgi:phage terminase small subunit
MDGWIGGDLMATATLHRLTGKQEQFARAFVELGSAAAAYRRIYATRPDLPGSTVWPEASRIRNLPNVAARITQLRERHAEQTGVTIDTVTGQLQQAYELAIDCGQPSAAVAATMGLAKLHGLFKSRAEVQARNFVVSDSPAGRDQLEMEPKTPLTEAEWMVEYGVSAN